MVRKHIRVYALCILSVFLMGQTPVFGGVDACPQAHPGGMAAAGATHATLSPAMQDVPVDNARVPAQGDCCTSLDAHQCAMLVCVMAVPACPVFSYQFSSAKPVLSYRAHYLSAPVAVIDRPPIRLS